MFSASLPLFQETCYSKGFFVSLFLFSEIMSYFNVLLWGVSVKNTIVLLMIILKYPILDVVFLFPALSLTDCLGWWMNLLESSEV